MEENENFCDITIVSANFNNGSFLNDYFESILQSTFLPKELIIIDDGSMDNSCSIIEEYSAKHLFIKPIYLTQNVGFANALNIGIQKASAKYILRIDPDDIFHPDRIQKQYFYLENHPEVDLVGSNVSYFKDNLNKIIGNSNFEEHHSEIVHKYKSGEHGLLHGSILGKTHLFKRFNYIQSNVPAEDYDVFARMVRNGAFCHNLTDCLTFVRIHGSSVSNFLPFSTIQKTYVLRDQIFNTKTSRRKIRVNYLAMKYYRKYYYAECFLSKYLYLIIAVFYRPDKAIQRLLKFRL